MPAFFDHYYLHGLHSFWSQFTSYISGTRSRGSNQASAEADESRRELGRTNPGNGTSGESVALSSNEAGHYTRLGDKTKAARRLGGHSVDEDYLCTTETGAKPGSGASRDVIEMWTPHDGIGVVKTVDVENHAVRGG